MTFTPKGQAVNSRVRAIWLRKISGGALPPASNPNPPALQTELTSPGSLIQVMAPHMIG